VKIAIGFLLAAGIGIVCRLVGIPVPAPPAVVGALLVLSMTSGYLLADHIVRQRGAARPDKTPAGAGPGGED
jgi:XapX domain-containing protein